MPYSENLAERIRVRLGNLPDVIEKKMFGSRIFMLNGHMLCGATSNGFMVRVGARNAEDALALPHTRPMEMKGQPMAGYIIVDEDALSDAALTDWINRCMTFTATLPPKK